MQIREILEYTVLICLALAGLIALVASVMGMRTSLRFRKIHKMMAEFKGDLEKLEAKKRENNRLTVEDDDDPEVVEAIHSYNSTLDRADQAIARYEKAKADAEKIERNKQK